MIYISKFDPKDITTNALQKVKEEIKRFGLEKTAQKEKGYWQEEETIVGMHNVPNFIFNLIDKNVPEEMISKHYVAVALIERLVRLSRAEIMEEKRRK